MNAETNKIPAPILAASIAEKYTPAGTEEEKTLWTDVGRAFPHANSEGWQLKVRAGLSLSGTVVLKQIRTEGSPVLPVAQNQLVAYVVDEFDGAGGQKRRIWTEIGRAFPHKRGFGFNLMIRQGLSINGTIVLRAPTEDGGRPFADGTTHRSAPLKQMPGADEVSGLVAKLQVLAEANTDAIDVLSRLLGDDDFAGPEFEDYRLQVQIVLLLLRDAALGPTDCVPGEITT